MTVVRVRIHGMAHRQDVRVVTARLRDLEGVETVQADVGSALVVVRGRISAETVRQTVTELGYRADPG